MKKNRVGSFLVELVIYFAVLSFFIPLFFVFASETIRKLRAEQHIALKQMQLHTMRQQLRRDIQAAPVDIRAWHKTGPSVLMWHTEKHDIAWENIGTAIKRLEGAYDYGAAKWKQKKISTALDHNVHLHGTVKEKNGLIASVNIRLEEELSDNSIYSTIKITPFCRTVVKK